MILSPCCLLAAPSRILSENGELVGVERIVHDPGDVLRQLRDGPRTEHEVEVRRAVEVLMQRLD